MQGEHRKQRAVCRHASPAAAGGGRHRPADHVSVGARAERQHKQAASGPYEETLEPVHRLTLVIWSSGHLVIWSSGHLVIGRRSSRLRGGGLVISVEKYRGID